MKTHKIIDKKQAEKQILSKSSQAPKKPFKHRDRGTYHGRTQGS
jgi:hypothetical protein